MHPISINVTVTVFPWPRKPSAIFADIFDPIGDVKSAFPGRARPHSIPKDHFLVFFFTIYGIETVTSLPPLLSLGPKKKHGEGGKNQVSRKKNKKTKEEKEEEKRTPARHVRAGRTYRGGVRLTWGGSARPGVVWGGRNYGPAPGGWGAPNYGPPGARPRAGSKQKTGRGRWNGAPEEKQWRKAVKKKMRDFGPCLLLSKPGFFTLQTLLSPHPCLYCISPSVSAAK